MRHHLSKLRSRLRQVFFGPPYKLADRAALSPRGSKRGIRAVLVVVGGIWLSLVLIDNLARPWQRRVKSWQFFQGVREFSEVPNLPREIEPMPPPGNMASGLGVARVARPYLEAESKTPVYIEPTRTGFGACGRARRMPSRCAATPLPATTLWPTAWPAQLACPRAINRLRAGLRWPYPAFWKTGPPTTGRRTW